MNGQQGSTRNIAAIIREAPDEDYTFAELAEADLTDQEKGHAQGVRLDSHRRRYVLEAKPSRAQRDWAFTLDAVKHLFIAVSQDRQRLQQLQFANERLTNRVKRLEAEKAEKKIVVANEAMVRAEISRRRR